MSIFKHRNTKYLMPKILSFKNLRKAFSHIRSKGGKSAGEDGETIKSWTAEGTMRKLGGLYHYIVRAREDGYYTGKVRYAYINKGGGKRRRVAVLCLQDGIVMRAIYQVLSEVFESRFNNSNFGHRPRRNRGQAALHCQQLIKSGCTHWVKADVKDCYGSIPKRRMKGVIKAVFGEGYLLSLIHI